MTKRHLLPFCMMALCVICLHAQPRNHHRRMAFSTDTVMAHDPVMAYENHVERPQDMGDATHAVYRTDSAMDTRLRTWFPQPCMGSGYYPLARPLVVGLQLLHLWQEHFSHRSDVSLITHRAVER